MRLGLILLLGLSIAPAAAAAECAPPRDPTVTVTIAEAPVAIDRTRSHVELTRSVAGLWPGRSVFGITDGTRSTDIRYRFGILPTGDRYCVTFDIIDVKIDVAMVVHLASELVPGSCPYRVYAGHEQQHVDLDRQLLPMLRDRVEAAAAFVARRGATGSAEGAAIQALQEMAQREIRQALDRYAEERNRRQDALDTPEEYAKLQRRCGEDEIRALLGE